MAGVPEALALIRASNRKLKGDLRKSRRMFKSSFKRTGKDINKSLRGALAPLGVAAGVAGVAALGRQVLQFEETLVRLQIQARKGDAPEFLADLREETIGLAKATGQNRAAIAAGNTALVNLLGHTETTSERMEVLARASTATGATMEDLAGIAFKLDTAFDIVSGKDLEAALDALTFAGQQTSIPLDKMGLLLAKTAPLFKKFGKSGVDAAADLGAFLQVVQAKGSAATPEEVATQFASFVRALEKQQKRIRKLTGVDVTEIVGGRRQLKAPRQIFDELAKSQKVLSDKTLLTAAFGRGEAADFATAILENREQFEGLASASKEAGGTIQRDFKTFMESPAGRTKAAFNDMNEALLKAFTPERIEKFAEVMEEIADILEVVVDNAGTLIAAWAAFKIGGVALGFANMAGSLSGAAASSAGLLSNIGRITGGLVAAATAGFALGTALDQALGISDAISDALVETEARAIQIETGLLVSQAEKLGFGTRVREAALAPQGKTALGRREQLAASGIIRSAREAGIIGPKGEIEPAAAFRVAEQRAPTVFEEQAVETGQGLPAATEELIAAVKFAQQVQARTQVDVNVTVDQQGMLKAQETAESKARRSTQ